MLLKLSMKSKTIISAVLIVAVMFTGMSNLHGRTANHRLRHAIHEGDMEGVKKALNEGAEANFYFGDEPRHSPFIAAAYAGNREIMELLIKEGADIKLAAPIVAAYMSGHREIVKWLIDIGANVDARDHNDFALLPLAIKNKDWEFVDLFLEARANVNVQGSIRAKANSLRSLRTGKTGLILAAEEGNVTLVERLIKKGADPDIQDYDPPTIMMAYSYYNALMWASENGNTEIAKMLIDAEANVNIQDSFMKSTALMLASRRGYTEIVKMLLDAGAEVNLQKEYGVTALVQAVRYGHVEIVEMLLDAGADVSLEYRALRLDVPEGRYRKSENILGLAITFSYFECFSKLITHGLKIKNVEDDKLIENLYKLYNNSLNAAELINYLMDPNSSKSEFEKFIIAIIEDDLEQVIEVAPVKFGYWGYCSADKEVALEFARVLEREEIYEYLCDVWGVPEEGSWEEWALEKLGWVCFVMP